MPDPQEPRTGGGIKIIAVVNHDGSCPFHCGSQATDWDYDNCTDCEHGDRGKRDYPDYAWGRCAIRDVLTSAMFGDWDPSVNEAMGYDGGIHPPLVCASREVRS